MKRILSLTGILALAILFTSAISIGELPQDPPTKKGKKHIKMVKVDDDGKKMEIDTVIAADEIFIWNGDTLGGGNDFSKAMEKLQDLNIDLNFDMDFDKDGNMFVFKGDGDSAKQIRMKVMVDDDCEDIDIMKWHDKGDNDFIFKSPNSAHAPHIIRIDKQKGNVIDLSDPGIISYQKKDIKDGKEKIVIIREKPSEEEVEVHEEIIIHSDHNTPAFIHEGHPQKAKKIKVITGDEGKIEIFEDGEIWSVDEMEEGTKVIEKDGKKIIIKKIKEGDEMKVNVEVEEEIEEEK